MNQNLTIEMKVKDIFNILQKYDICRSIPIINQSLHRIQWGRKVNA